MENLDLAFQFKPPPPYSVGGHFDAITNDRYSEAYFRNLQNIFAFDIDRILQIIHARPTPVERAAMLDVLESRLRGHGETRGYLDPPKEKGTSPGQVLTSYFIEQVMGLSGDSAEQKAASELRQLVRKAIELGLNDTGKSQLTFLKWVWDVGSAGSATTRWSLMISGPGEKLTKTMFKHRDVIMNAMKKVGPVPPIVIERLRKIIALRMAWRPARLAVRFAWVSPVVLALDLLLTPSEIASDEKIAFLGIYTRVCEDRRILQTSIIDRCAPDGWKYKFDPVVVLRAAIKG